MCERRLARVRYASQLCMHPLTCARHADCRKREKRSFSARARPPHGARTGRHYTSIASGRCTQTSGTHAACIQRMRVAHAYACGAQTKSCPSGTAARRAHTRGHSVADRQNKSTRMHHRRRLRLDRAGCLSLHRSNHVGGEAATSAHADSIAESTAAVVACSAGRQ